LSRPDGSIVIDTKVLEGGFKKGFSSLQRIASTASLAIGGSILAAAGAFVAFSIAAVGAAEADAIADKRIRSITESMELFGDQAGIVSDRLTDLATKTAIATGVDDASIKATQAKLLTFAELAATADEVGGAFDRATLAAIDLAAAGFGEAETNAVQLGKALQDPIKGITALARSGVTFTDAEKEQIRTLVEANKMLEAQDLILQAIEKQVGGTALATASTSERLKVVMGELQEAAGGPLLALFDALGPKLIDSLAALTPAIEQTFGGLAKVLSGDMAGAGELAAGLSSLGTTLADALSKTLPPLVNALAQVIIALAQAIPPMLPPLVDALLSSLQMIVAALPSIIPSIVEAASGIVAAVVTALPILVPALLDGVYQLIGAVLAQLPTLLPVVITAVLELIVGVAGALMRGQAVLYSGLETLMAALAEMMPTLYPLLIDTFVTMLVMMTEQIPIMLPMFLDAFIVLTLAIAAALPRMMPAISNAIDRSAPILAAAVVRMVPKLVSAMMSQGPVIAKMGGDIVSGMWEGIQNKTGWLIGKIKSWAHNVTDSLKSFFKISSPSKLFRDEIGSNLALGIGEGFALKVPSVVASMSNAVSGEMGRFMTAAIPQAARAGAGSVDNSRTVTFNGRVSSYSEMLRAEADIARGLV
jgi:phage-related protein